MRTFKVKQFDEVKRNPQNQREKKRISQDFFPLPTCINHSHKLSSVLTFCGVLSVTTGSFSVIVKRGMLPFGFLAVKRVTSREERLSSQQVGHLVTSEAPGPFVPLSDIQIVLSPLS